jgi:hypothetical protein
MVRDTVSLPPSPQRTAILRRFEVLGGEAGSFASQRLESETGVDEETRGRLAREWKATQSFDALARIHHAVVERVPVGTPLEVLRDILGEPSGEDETGVWYTASDRPLSLFLYLDADEKVVSSELGSS